MGTPLWLFWERAEKDLSDHTDTRKVVGPEGQQYNNVFNGLDRPTTPRGPIEYVGTLNSVSNTIRRCGHALRDRVLWLDLR